MPHPELSTPPCSPLRWAAPLLFAATVCLSGCDMALPKFGRQSPAAVPQLSDAESSRVILGWVESLRTAGPAGQAELVAAARQAYEAEGSLDGQLRYALALAAPGIPGAEPQLARRHLGEVLARGDRLQPGPRALAQLALAEVDARLTLQSDNLRLQTEGALRDRERTTALTLLLASGMLLALRAFQLGDTDDNLARTLEGTVLVLCAVVVGLLMQAVATDRRQALTRVALQARQDMTTGLLNDRGLLNELAERLAAPERPGYGLVGIHIANFDTINDLCGPIQGLHLEQGVAMLLMRQPGALQAARLSSGRFALMIVADSVTSVRALARELYAQLNGQVYKAEHGSIRLQASVGGLLIAPSIMIESEDCLVSLSDAMSIAASVRDPQLFVEPLSQSIIDTRRAHQGKLEHVREAIRAKRLEIFAQPMIDPDAPAGMLAYEVLIRMRDPAGQLIRPPEFLPLAVQAQMTVALDRSVIEMVFEWLAQHPEALARTWKCSINLSGMTMSDGMIAAFIRDQRARFGIPAARIVFEITESEAIRNPGAASRLVDELRAEGFGIALDDFGTGLATFEYLKRFPIDYLKIDGSFIRNLVNDPIDEEIVLSTVRVARRLNVKTIAEHVHNLDVYDRVCALGVGFVQGTEDDRHATKGHIGRQLGCPGVQGRLQCMAVRAPIPEEFHDIDLAVAGHGCGIGQPTEITTFDKFAGALGLDRG